MLSSASGALAQSSATPEAVAAPQALLPSNWNEAKGQTAKVNGIDLYYEVYGAGNPVILLHGGLANGTYYRNQIPVLAANYQVIVVDSRGHGRSTFDQQPISYELMASDVLGLMDQLGLKKASIVGWSDGGIIGLELAIHHPDRLNKVVAYGANFDPSGVRLDVGTNAKFTAYTNQAEKDYKALSPAPERWDEFLNNIYNMWATEPNYSEDQLKAITTPILILDGETGRSHRSQPNQADGPAHSDRDAEIDAGYGPFRDVRAAAGVQPNRRSLSGRERLNAVFAVIWLQPRPSS